MDGMKLVQLLLMDDGFLIHWESEDDSLLDTETFNMYLKSDRNQLSLTQDIDIES